MELKYKTGFNYYSFENAPTHCYSFYAGNSPTGHKKKELFGISFWRNIKQVENFPLGIRIKTALWI